MRRRELIGSITLVIAVTWTLGASSSAIADVPRTQLQELSSQGAAMPTTTGSAGAAAETLSTAANCSPGVFCLWTGKRFTGKYDYLRDHNGCLTFLDKPRSYDNNSNIEGYFYSGSVCTGSVRAARVRTENPDIGFSAGSFRQACVSCRSKG
jgi:hypothetical protein